MQNDRTDKIFEFWLCNLRGIGYKKRKYMLEQIGSPREIFYAKEAAIEQIAGCSQKDKENILCSRDLEQLKRQYDRMQQQEIHFVTEQEKEYPQKLINVSEKPYGIFYKGRLPEESRPSVAIVGARSASYEGREIARKFGYELAANGVQVISGMARGVDIAAQEGAMKQIGGRTFSLLGTGVDICYPREHIGFYEAIQKDGGVISEFPLGTPPMPYHFPMRNRLISGFADGVLVIEARRGSGSLITAEIGLEQGKEIFVVPGNILNSGYQGGNDLLKNGAFLVTEVKDILDGLGLFFDMDVVEKKKNTNLMLETTEKIVYAILSLEPIHISQIMEITGLELQKIMEVLISMQKKHVIKTIGNNYFVVCL